jgi:hypothetical protein
MLGNNSVAAAVGLAVIGCAGQDATGPRPALSSGPAFSSSTNRVGAVYVMTNSPSENEVDGLDHSLDCRAVMYSLLRGLETKRDVTDDDVAAITTLYPLEFEPLSYQPPRPRSPGKGQH